jgi:signal transduction histidine kinase
MLSSLETARGMLSPNSPAAPAVDLTVRAARRSSQLARRLMDYSRNRATDNEIVDLVALIDSLQPLLARAVTGRARLALDLPEGPVICKLDAGRLEDALINLCLNARDALENGGNVRVSVGVENSDPAQAIITVADTGEGMPPEVLARVFERHFTTKPEGQGTGLGLASVKDFVEAEGGVIAIDSTPGKGTTVRLALPLAA